ncbi:MAG: ribosome recycling factor [bacterium]|nr:ribosome recycling factor [bacterium]
MHHPLLTQHEEKFREVIARFQKDIASFRAGHASPSLVEDISVMAYGVRTPLKQLAAISIPEPRMIAIQPWDKNVVKDIERAIQESQIGMMPAVEGSTIRLTLPQLTEERRRELVKELGKVAEESQVRMRSIRDTIREEVVSKERAGELGEDDKYRLFKDVDEMTQQFSKNIVEIAAKKEEEILTI